jgi:hypothetical protein
MEGAGWSRGRVLPLGRLLDQAGWDWLSAQDRLVIRQLERTHQLADGSSLAELEGEAPCPAAGSSGAVLGRTARSAGHAGSGQISLLLQRQQQQMVLQLSPPGIAACQHCLWQRSGANSLLVYWPGPEIRQLAALLGHRLSVPVAARKKLLEAIGDMVPWLPVELVEADDGADLPAMPADPRLFAVLVPLPEGLRLQLRCRVAGQAAWYPPGRGPWQQVALEQGQAIRFQRQLRRKNRHWRPCWRIARRWQPPAPTRMACCNGCWPISNRPCKWCSNYRPSTRSGWNVSGRKASACAFRPRPGCRSYV